MTLPSVAVDEPITASNMNQLITHVNGSPNRTIFTSNGTWVQPDGCHRFKITLCGGGGAPGRFYGNRGGDSPMVSYIHSGSDIGSSFVITVGGAGVIGTPSGSDSTAGGTSSFGTLLSSTGGTQGSSNGTSVGSRGSASFPPGAPQVYHANDLFLYGHQPVPYGHGGNGVSDLGVVTSDDLTPGIVVVEW